MPSLIEKSFLKRIARGDQAAVAECLDCYGGLVWSLAKRFSPDEQAAEDAIQDVFLNLWKAADRFNPEIASEKTFVAMIARRRLIDISRRKAWPSPSEMDFAQVDSREKSGSEQAELTDEAAKATQLLSKLPESQQSVIRLSIYEGLSHSKIAERTGLSLGTVKTHIRRGLISLRKSLFASKSNQLSQLFEMEGEVSQ